MKKNLFMLVAILACLNVSAQDNGLNPVYKVQLGDITYQKGEASKKVTVGKVLGVIADVAEGRVTDVNNEEYIPLAKNCVTTGLTHVRRLQVVADDEGETAKYLVTAQITDITASRKLKTYDRKDSKGREYTETKTYYGAVTSVALTFKNLQTGELTTSTISGRCSEYSLAKSADEAIRTALGELAENIYEYYNEVYPVRANIIERGTEKKDKTKESMWWDRLPVVRHASRLVESASARRWAATSHSAKCRKVARKSRLPLIGAMPSWLSVQIEPTTMICIFFRIFLGESGIFCIFAAEMNYQY